MTRQAAPARPVGSRRRDGAGPVPRQVYRRRRAAVLLGLLLVGLGVAARVLVYDAGLLDVAEVRVTGAGALSVEAVVEASAVVPGGPLAEVDTGAVTARVRELPAVGDVRVERQWPHTVLIALTERVPVAVVQSAQVTGLVDATGVVFPGEPDGPLPRLTVDDPGPADPSTLAAVAAVAALPPAVREQVRTVDARITTGGAPGQVVLGLTRDRLVRWGSPERGREKAEVLVPLLTQPGTVYDVTSPDLPTIRL